MPPFPVAPGRVLGARLRPGPRFPLRRGRRPSRPSRGPLPPRRERVSRGVSARSARSCRSHRLRRRVGAGGGSGGGASRETPKGELSIGLLLPFAIDTCVGVWLRPADAIHCGVVGALAAASTLSDVVSTIGSVDVVFGAIDMNGRGLDSSATCEWVATAVSTRVSSCRPPRCERVDLRLAASIAHNLVLLITQASVCGSRSL